MTVTLLSFCSFKIFDKALHALQIIGERFTTGGGDRVGCFWSQSDERLFTGDVAAFLKFTQVQIQASIHGIESFF